MIYLSILENFKAHFGPVHSTVCIRFNLVIVQSIHISIYLPLSIYISIYLSILENFKGHFGPGHCVRYNISINLSNY